MPSQALQAGAEVPGRLGPVMWNWEDNAQWGRLPPGWYYLKLGRWRVGSQGSFVLPSGYVKIAIENGHL